MKRLMLSIVILIALIVSPYTTSADSYKDWIDKGENFYSSGDHKKAIDAYTRAIELHPANATAYSGRGLSYLKLGNYYRAITDFNNAIDLNHPKMADVYFRRGMTYNELGKYQQAIKDYNKTIELNPEDGQAYFFRGIVYMNHLLNYHQAYKDYKTAARLGYKKAQYFLKSRNIKW